MPDERGEPTSTKGRENGTLRLGAVSSNSRGHATEREQSWTTSLLPRRERGINDASSDIHVRAAIAVLIDNRGGF